MNDLLNWLGICNVSHLVLYQNDMQMAAHCAEIPIPIASYNTKSSLKVLFYVHKLCRNRICRVLHIF